jgi:PAS domain S-box-containing protein
MNKQSENHEEIARIVDQLTARKGRADARVVQSPPHIEHAYNHISGTLVDPHSGNEKENKENIEKNHHINSVQQSDVTTDLTERYRLIAQNTSDLIAFTTFDANPVYTFVSPSHKKILGYAEEDLLGKSGLDFIHEDDKQPLMTLLFSYIDAKINNAITTEMLENIFKIDYRIRDKSGNWHFLRSTVDLVGNEMLFISKDITVQKQIEDALRKSEEKFLKAFKSSPVAIAINRISDGTFLEVNKSLERLIGYTRDELLTQPSLGLNVWVDINDRKNLYKEIVKTGSVYDQEYRFRSKSDDVIITRYSGEVIDFSGEHCILSVLFDITQSKNDERILKEKIEELERYKNVTINREIKMIELKNEINELCKQLNQKSKYANISQDLTETGIL